LLSQAVAKELEERSTAGGLKSFEKVLCVGLASFAMHFSFVAPAGEALPSPLRAVFRRQRSFDADLQTQAPSSPSRTTAVLRTAHSTFLPPFPFSFQQAKKLFQAQIDAM
jgi:hypothetical protein